MNINFLKNNGLRLYLSVLMFLLSFGITNAATITSTSDGGSWTSESTWIGGKVPGDYDNIIINGEVIYGNVTVGGNLEIGEDGHLQKDGNNGNYRTLTVEGNFVNNGILGGEVDLYSNRTYVHSKGDFVNNGTVSNLYSFYIYSDFEDNGSFDSNNNYLIWDKIDGYDDYIIDLSYTGSIEVNNSNYYKIDESYLTSGDEIKWNIEGNGLLSNESDGKGDRCINVDGCIVISSTNEGNSGFEIAINEPYSSSESANSSSNTYTNYLSTLSVKEDTNIPIRQKLAEESVSTEICVEGDKGDPVNLNTGEFTYNNTLMYYSGKGLPFEFNINYKNKAYYNGPLGNNFDFNYNMFLIEDTDGNINFHNGNLGVLEFEKSGTGFIYNDIIKSELTVEDGKHIINQNNEKFITFGENNRVESISDKYDNKLLFTYSEEGQLLKVTDTLLREYIFTYYEDTRLEKITDFLGNNVEFTYYDDNSEDGGLYDLETIKTTNNSDTREISFTYTKDDDFVYAHNIIKLIDSADNTYVENTYDENDRVSSQKYGNGTINYNYTLSSSGNITENRVVNRLGNQTTYYYDDNSNTIKKVIEKSSGDVTYSYEYNSDNKLTKEIKPLGDGITYKYDENGNIIEKRIKSDISAEDSEDDIVTQTTYNLDWNIPTQIISENGLITNFTIDEFGNIIKKETLGVKDVDDLSLDISESFTYNASGELINQTDAGGLVTSFEYSSGSLISTTKGTGTGSITTSYDYDNKGNITKITDGEGNITNLSYDDFNLLTKQITPEGITSEFTYNKLNKKINESIILSNNGSVNTSYLYDVLDNPTQITKDINSDSQTVLVTNYDADNRVTETRNGSGAISKFSYNETGQIIKKTILNGVEEIITTYTYDDNNRLLTETNPNGGVTTYEYDNFGRLIKQTFSDDTYSIFTNDIVGNIVETNNYSSSGALVQKQTAEYDLLNRAIISNKYILEPTEIKLTTKVKYDSVGNVTESTDEKDRIINYSYDDFHRLIRTIQPSGNKVIQEYNNNDKVIKKQIISTDGKIITTNYQYDKDNRLVKQIDTNGDFETFEYNNLNQIIKKTDKIGNIINYTYDYSGKLLQEEQGEKLTKYEYDERGNMIKLIDSNDNETIYTYDELNRLLTRTYSDGTSVIFEYDSVGNIIKTTDANGNIINNTYDISGRLISRDITPTTQTQGITSETYSYDSLGRLIEANDSDNNLLSFEYDSLGRLISETNSGDKITYTYDETNNLVEKIYPDGKVIKTTLDEQDRVTSILSNDVELVKYTYDSLSLINKSYSNNTSTDYEYDELLRLKNLDLNSLAGSGTIISDYSYTYDKNGNITSDGTENYTYDIYNRLEKVDYTDILSEEYEFDNIGNRETVISTNSGIIESTSYQNNNLNQITDTGTGTEISHYEYDLSGNLKKDNDYNYFYDYKNRLMKVTDLSDILIVKYSYDILGRRISKTLGDGTEYSYTYSNKQKIIETKTQNSISLKKEYIYGNATDDVLAVYSEELTEGTENQDEIGFCNRVVFTNEDEFITYDWQEIVDRCDTLSANITKETNLYYYHKNHLGSIVSITDNSGNVVENYSYDVYGNILNYTDSLIGNDIYFTGREFEKEIGLYYNRARYYIPETGRFISRDPIDIVDDINLYAYVGNNPIGFVDLMGTEKVLIIGGKETYKGQFTDALIYQKGLFSQKGILDKNIITIDNVISPEDFNKEVEKYIGNIKEIVLISHGSELEKWDTSELNSINNNSCLNTNITIIACNSGEGMNSVGKEFSNNLGITSTAPNTFVSLDKKNGSGLTASNLFKKSGKPSIYNIASFKKSIFNKELPTRNNFIPNY